jgi:hypothetical protein
LSDIGRRSPPCQVQSGSAYEKTDALDIYSPDVSVVDFATAGFDQNLVEPVFTLEIQLAAHLIHLKEDHNVRLLISASRPNGIPNVSIGFLLFYAPTTAYRRVASRRLEARFPDTSAQVWHSTRTWQSRLAPNRPRHSASVNLLMRYMEWSCALYRAVQEHGMSQTEAATLVEKPESNGYWA